MKSRILSKKDSDKKENSLDNNTLKVIFAGCIAIVIALLFMSITSMVITNNAVVEKLKRSDLKNMAESIASTIEARIEKAVNASLILANDPVVIRWIQSSNEDEMTGNLTEDKMRQLANTFGFDTAFLTSVLTNHYWSYNNGKFELLDVVSEEDPNDDWFFNTLKIRKEYQINIDANKELNDTYVWINAMVGDPSAPLAITGVGMRLDDVIENLREESEDELKNDIWLVDAAGTIQLSKNQIYFGKALEDFLPDDTTASIIDPQKDTVSFKAMQYKDDEGALQDIAYKTIKDTDWKLIIQIPRSESMGFMKTIIWNTIAACMFIIVIMIVMFYLLTIKIANPYKRTLQLNQELEKKVQERTKELNEKNIKIQDSIEVAKRIQESILPSETEMQNILKEHFVIWEPRDTVGGDFYWVKNFDDGFLVIVGDCTGHGVPGAFMTAAVNAMLNHIVDEICHDDPAFILQELDRLMKQSFMKSGDELTTHDGLDAGVVFVSEEKKILFSGARFSLILLDKNGIKEIKGSRDTIDCLGEEEKSFTNKEIKKDKDVSLYLVTDGLTDQPGGSKGLPYGKSRLLSLLKTVGCKKMTEQRLEIINAKKAYSQNEMIRDDITVLGFKIS